MNRNSILPMFLKEHILVALISFLMLCAACNRHIIDQFKITKEETILQTEDFEVKVLQTNSNRWGIAVETGKKSSVRQLKPVVVEYYQDEDNIRRDSAGYENITIKENGFNGRATLMVAGAKLEVEDQWKQDEGLLKLKRNVKVIGDQKGGFLTSFTFKLNKGLSWTDVNWFAPGMIYGGFENITAEAIGGKAFYDPDSYFVHIREDRLPAPLFGAHFKNGSSLTILNPSPDGMTTRKDGRDTKGKTLIDSRFRFGAIGGSEQAGKLSMGYWYPGSEGEVTYKGNTYPDGQLHQWRRRYHPVRDGLTQSYEMTFRFKKEETLQEFYRASWRTAWQQLQPEPKYYDINKIRTELTNMLADQVVTKNGRAGIPLALIATTGELANKKGRYNAMFGFTGRNIASAYHLLKEASCSGDKRAERFRSAAIKVIDTFLKLETNPPRYDGIELRTGEPARLFKDNYLRSFADAAGYMLRAYTLEKSLGHEQPEWLAWVRDFATWLLAHQSEEGGFPRSWKKGTADILDSSPESTYNAIPFLVNLFSITNDKHYLNAAIQAGEVCWRSIGQANYQFVGGTKDNPNIIDKEAGTISLRAYLDLYEITKNQKWLDRAEVAADFSETWIYIRDVPMPKDISNDKLHWKKEVSTIGTQLIASGHSLTDQYMAFNADEYARLYQYTNDPHYLEVSKILLHNTKNMLAMEGRTYDLYDIGWQQEHFSMAPPRGIGLHRLWLPWVTVSHLDGIIGIEKLNQDLYKNLVGKSKAK